MEIDKQAVGRRICDRRQHMGLSMAALAIAIGVAGKSTINDWEKGRSLPSAPALKQLAQTLKTTSGFLYYGSLPTYTFAVLKRDGLNHSEFNVLLWEYIDLTTTNPNLLSGAVFNDEQADAANVSSAIIEPHIDTALQEIIPAVLDQFVGPDYPDEPELISRACNVFRQRIQLIRRTFTGKYNRIVRLLDNVDLYEKLPVDSALRDYLNQHTAPAQNGFQLDKAYQDQMNALITTFHQQLNRINADYQQSIAEAQRANEA